MSMVVQHNIEAIDAYNATRHNVSGVKKSSEKLASGERINRAGDDAAGLAISQKVGSQITGLNQAVRNSQDGINMIQVFEGAAEESQSVLQRMKLLAEQSANGTYDDNVDREAINHEFMHMNDELNQLADTDFNGTVVLNGGIMADGTMAMPKDSPEGTFKFEDWNTKIQYQLPVDLVSRYDVTYTPPASDASDYSAGKYYDPNAVGAGMLWANAKTECKALVEAADKAAAENNADEVSMTIIYKVTSVDDDGQPLSWQGYYYDGNDENGNPGKTAYGGEIIPDGDGFIDQRTGMKVSVDVIHSKPGDFIAVEYRKPYPDPIPPSGGHASKFSHAHTNDAKPVMKDGIVPVSSDDINATTDDGRPFFDLTNSDIKDNVENWDEEMFEIMPRLDGSTIQFEFDGSSINIYLGQFKIYLKDPNGNDLLDTSNNMATKGYDSGNAPTQNPITGGKLTVATLADKITSDLAMSQFKLTYGDHYIGTININYIYGKDNVDSNHLTNEKDTISFKLNFTGYSLPIDKEPTADVVNIDPYYAPVSIPNYYDQSNAHMNYTEHLTLQAGARTKDAVNFTFNYARGNSILGDLEPNINISAREGGLNTEKLTLANQEDANKAIDAIDAAINKVSLLRATFGAMQNRLDHKVSNMTETNRNLTESRSYIQDTDMAEEVIGYAKFNVLQQAAQSILAQANQSPQSLLQLLGGQ